MNSEANPDNASPTGLDSSVLGPESEMLPRYCAVRHHRVNLPLHRRLHLVVIRGLCDFRDQIKALVSLTPVYDLPYSAFSF